MIYTWCVLLVSILKKTFPWLKLTALLSCAVQYWRNFTLNWFLWKIIPFLMRQLMSPISACRSWKWDPSFFICGRCNNMRRHMGLLHQQFQVPSDLCPLRLHTFGHPTAGNQKTQTMVGAFFTPGLRTAYLCSCSCFVHLTKAFNWCHKDEQQSPTNTRVLL